MDNVCFKSKCFWMSFLLIAVLFFPLVILHADNDKKVITVKNVAELNRAFKNLEPGIAIVLAKGQYDGHIDGIANQHGTPGNLITIRSEAVDQAVFTGVAILNIKNCSYIVIEGIKFTAPNLTSVTISGSNHIRITRCHITHQDIRKDVKWVMLDGPNNDFNRFDHNLVEEKHAAGQMLCIRGVKETGIIGQHNMIDHNNFRNNTPRIPNGQETLQIGLSEYTLSKAYTIVEYNVFENCDGDPEFISVKSCNNTIRYNTFFNNMGNLCLRQGNSNEVYCNYFLGDGSKKGLSGIRIYGEDHRIYCNYFEGLTGTNKTAAIIIDSGDQESSHAAAQKVEVVNNTIVNCNSGIALGPGYHIPPSDIKVANNLICNPKGNVILESLDCKNILYEGNLGFSNDTGVSNGGNKYKVIDPKLEKIGGVYVIPKGSPVANAEVGDYPYIKEDIEGKSIEWKKDVGCYELSTSPATRKPLTKNDVGMFAK